MSTTEATTPDPLELLLRGALLPERPDPDAFEAGIRGRIRAKEERAHDEAVRFERSSPTLQVAASFLPPMLVPFAAKAIGAKSLAVTIKSMGLKSLPGLAALPVLALAMLVITFFGALRNLRRGADDAPTEPTEPTEPIGTPDTVITQWWRRNRRGALFSFAVLALLVVTANAEAALFLMGISMLAVTLLLSELARSGFAKRKAVGNWIGFTLIQLALNWFMVRDLIPMPASAFGNVAAPLLIGCAGFACVLIGQPIRPTAVWRWIANPIPMKHPDAVTLWTLRIGAGISVIVVSVVMAFGLSALAISAYATGTRSDEDPARLARALETFDEPESEIVRWRTFSEQLRSYGVEVARELDLSNARKRLSTALRFTAGTKTALVAAGVAPDDAILTLVESARAQRLIEHPSEASLNSGPELLALAQTGQLPASARASAVTALIAGLPELPEQGGLADARELVFLVEQLGGATQLDALAPRVHALLTLHWTGEPGNPHASDRFQFSRPSESYFKRRLDAIASLELPITIAAVDLIDRFGAPEHIDLEQLHLSLVRTCKTIPLPFFKRRNALAAAGLIQLATSRRVPERTFWQKLVRERVSVGAALLALFAVMAVARTPKEIEQETEPESDGVAR